MSQANFNLAPRTAISVATKVALGAAGLHLMRKNQQLSKELELERHNSKLDTKTGLLIYPSFEQEVVKRTRSTERAIDSGRTHALVLLDLDDFKRWNTRLTHPRTDKEALLPVATAMKAAMRSDTDLASRFGGEEFVFFLSDTDEEGAHIVCEKLQGQINAIHPQEGSPDTLGATMSYMTFEQGTYLYNLEDPLTDLSAQLIAAKEIPGKNQIVPLQPSTA